MSVIPSLVFSKFFATFFKLFLELFAWFDTAVVLKLVSVQVYSSEYSACQPSPVSGMNKYVVKSSSRLP